MAFSYEGYDFYAPIPAYQRVFRDRNSEYLIDESGQRLMSSFYHKGQCYGFEVTTWQSTQTVLVEATIPLIKLPTNQMGCFAVVGEYNSRQGANSTIFYSAGLSAFVWQMPLIIAGTPGVTLRQAAYTIDEAVKAATNLHPEIRARAYNWPVFTGKDKELYERTQAGHA